MNQAPEPGVNDLAVTVPHAAELRPYVRRDVDDHLDRALGDNRFVVLAGDSGSGTSRTALEAVSRVFPDAPLLTVGPGRSVRSLARPAGWRLTATGGSVVVWLDRLDRHLGRPGGLDTGLLDELAERDPPVVVLATVSSAFRERLLASRGGLGQAGRLVLRQATTVRLEFTLSEAERARAERLYPGRRLEDGIGLRLGGGIEPRGRFEAARAGSPVGWALVQAAADWRRMGLDRPVDERVLRALAAPYLEEAGVAGEPLEPALAWAGQASLGRPPLLTTSGRAPARSFAAPAHLAAVADGEAGGRPRPVPPRAWEVAVDHATGEELLGVAFAAYLHDAPAAAERAWRTALTAGDAVTAHWAETNLALLGAAPTAAASGADPAGDGPVPGRLRAVRTDEAPPGSPGAAGTGDTATDPAGGDAAALLGQGVAAERHGDLQAARAAYRRAAGSGHPDAGPAAMANLGALLAQEGDARGARRALSQAMSSGHPDAAPFAAVALGTLYLQQGRPERAGEAFRWAVRSGHPEQAPAAAVGLGKLLAERGDLQGAVATLDLAATSGHARQAPRAAVDLGLLLVDQGDLAGAETAFRSAADAGDRDYRAWGLVGLGMVAAMRGDLEAALPVYLEVQASGHEDAAQVALRHLRALTGAAPGDGRRRARRPWRPTRPARP
jgi:Flp pilus assembly protein TadD